MISISCEFPPTDLDSLTPDEIKRFGKLVHDLRKKGKDLKTAQRLAFQRVLVESLPYVEK